MTRGRPSPWPLVAVLLAARLSAARPDCATEPCGAAALMPRDDGRFPLSAAFDLSAALVKLGLERCATPAAWCKPMAALLPSTQ